MGGWVGGATCDECTRPCGEVAPHRPCPLIQIVMCIYVCHLLFDSSLFQGCSLKHQ